MFILCLKYYFNPYNRPTLHLNKCQSFLCIHRQIYWHYIINSRQGHKWWLKMSIPYSSIKICLWSEQKLYHHLYNFVIQGSYWIFRILSIKFNVVLKLDIYLILNLFLFYFCRNIQNEPSTKLFTQWFVEGNFSIGCSERCYIGCNNHSSLLKGYSACFSTLQQVCIIFSLLFVYFIIKNFTISQLSYWFVIFIPKKLEDKVYYHTDIIVVVTLLLCDNVLFLFAVVTTNCGNTVIEIK